MKDFFSEYGRLIIVGALVILVLMFTTPFAEAVTGSVANFTTGMVDKYEPWELIDGDNVVLTDNDGDGVASKGDILTFKKEYLYQGNPSNVPVKFRIINTDGNTAEILALSELRRGIYYNTLSQTTTDSKGNIVQKYEGSTIDTELNNTYYQTLKDDIKSKICSKEITQYSWKRNSTPADATSWYKENFTASDTAGTEYTLSKIGTVGTYNRNIYVLDVQDIVDYLGSSFTPQELNKMFFDVDYAFSFAAYSCLWLRSAYSLDRTLVFRIHAENGVIDCDGNKRLDYYLHPAFTITLREGFF